MVVRMENEVGAVPESGGPEKYYDALGNVIPDEAFENEPSAGPLNMSPEAEAEFFEKLEREIEAGEAEE